MRTIAAALVCVIGVFAQKIEIEADQDANFTSFKTFTIAEGRLNSRSPSLNSDLIRKRLDGDIRKSLEAKGLAYVESGRADLRVHYTLGAAQRTAVERYPAGWRGLGTRIVRVPFTEGTLVIDLRNPATRSLVWRAIAREDKSDAAQIERKLDDMVRKAFGKYPPKAK